MKTKFLVSGLALGALLALTAAPGPSRAGSCQSGATASTAGHHEHAKKDIVETAVAAGDFQTLAAALKAAGLVEALKGEGPFTVFAPTDAAFARLPEGTVDELLKPENRERLQRILKYHVVSGEVTAAAVVDLDQAQTLSGDAAPIAVRDGKVYVGDAQVVKTDILAGNGVIHVIDTVLIPGQES